MKGMAAVLAILVVGIIFSVSVIMMLLVPMLIFRVHLNENVNIQVSYSNVDLALMAMLSSDYNGQSNWENFGSYYVFNNPPNLDFAESKLQMIFGGDCFELSDTSGVLLSNPCDEKKYESVIKIPLTYNPNKLVEEIKLVIE